MWMLNLECLKMFCPDCSEVLIPVWNDGMLWWYCPVCEVWYKNPDDCIYAKEVTMMAH